MSEGPSPKKPPVRKIRANTILGGLNDKDSSFTRTVEPSVDVPAMPAPKISWIGDGCRYFNNSDLLMRDACRNNDIREALFDANDDRLENRKNPAMSRLRY